MASSVRSLLESASLQAQQNSPGNSGILAGQNTTSASNSNVASSGPNPPAGSSASTQASAAATPAANSSTADTAAPNNNSLGNPLPYTSPAAAPRRPTTVMVTDAKTGGSTEISYQDCRVVGNGSFGVVYEATVVSSGERVAIKKVLQDRRFKNRELQIMRMIDHVNVVALYSFFYSTGDKPDDVYLNLVIEHVPETIYRLTRNYSRQHQSIPMQLVKLYTYQLFRSLVYIHALGISHRDIKPQNLLIDSASGVLKLCDFGSAKVLVPSEPNVSYICSRYYRAPELIFGAVVYDTKIDVWSSGCVLGELVTGAPIFPGDSGVDQLVEIIKILGTPQRSQVVAMNPNYTDNRFPAIEAQAWDSVLGPRATPDLVDLTRSIMRYEPHLRPSAIETIAHEYFDELRAPNFAVAGIPRLPKLFDFTALELSIRPDINHRLMPRSF